MNDMQKEIMRAATQILTNISGPYTISRAVSEAKTLYDEVLKATTGKTAGSEIEKLDGESGIIDYIIYTDPNGSHKKMSLKMFRKKPIDEMNEMLVMYSDGDFHKPKDMGFGSIRLFV